MGLCAGKNLHKVKEDLRRNYVPALILEGGVWPVVQVFNFWYVSCEVLASLRELSLLAG